MKSNDVVDKHFDYCGGSERMINSNKMGILGEAVNNDHDDRVPLDNGNFSTKFVYTSNHTRLRIDRSCSKLVGFMQSV